MIMAELMFLLFIILYLGAFYYILTAMIKKLQEYSPEFARNNFGMTFFITLFWGPILIIALIELAIKYILKLLKGTENE